MSRRLAVTLGLFAVAVAAAADDPALPASLPEKERQAVKRFLDGLPKPTRLIPPKARVTAYGPRAAVEVDAEPAGEVKEYLASIVPHRAADKGGPARADVYHYRPNPKRGSPGVTVKRTVDLATGEAVGEPEVLLGYPAPITREEREQAIKLARDEPTVKAIYAAAPDEKDVEVAVLFETVSAEGVPGANVGDRVATLLYRTKGARPVAAAVVNLTQQTVRPQSADK
jgi:hypothetical protein